LAWPPGQGSFAAWGFPWGAEVMVGLALASLVLLLASLALVPSALRRLPADYFIAPPRARARGWGATARTVGRNLVGAVLLLLGVAMLVLPGQGLLTIAASLTLLDFPGRRALLRRIVAIPRLRRGIDAWRRARDLPPLLLDPEPRPPP
jgi:hypothetical protein